MIYIILGGSRAGKTTFTINTFLRCESSEYKDLITLTETDSAILFGTYRSDDRRKGTDTTNRKDILVYFSQIEKLKEKKKDIVLEGTRVSGKLLQQLFVSGYDVQLIWIKASPNKILERNRNAGNTQTTHHFIAEVTKAQYAFWRYALLCNGVIYDTDSINEPEEWENFDINSPRIEVNERLWFSEFRNFCLKSDTVNSSEDFATCFVNVIQYPSCVKVYGTEKGYKSISSKSAAFPELISERWKK